MAWRRPRLFLSRSSLVKNFPKCGGLSRIMATDVGVALLGTGFMGKAHSNAFRQVSRFFPGKLQPRMRVICGTNAAKAQAAAGQYGWEEADADWRRVIERKDIHIVDICTPNH